jgi:hypothetical protein
VQTIPGGIPLGPGDVEELRRTCHARESQVEVILRRDIALLYLDARPEWIGPERSRLSEADASLEL